MTPAPFWRRLAAMVYDSFVIFSFLLFATAFALIPTQGGSLLPYQFPFLVYLIFSTGLFLSWFWTKSGQTIGMLAWKIKVVDRDGKKLTFTKALQRYFFALISVASGGLGWLPCLFAQKQSLHDILARTKVINAPASKPSSPR